MGQYYLTVNIDKRQYLHPHNFNEGMKLMEFGCGSGGVMTALAILLSDGNGRGGGDFGARNGHDTDPLVGSWAGDRIVVAGDYADAGTHLSGLDVAAWMGGENEDGEPVSSPPNLAAVAREHFEDISNQMRALMVLGDEWLAARARR